MEYESLKKTGMLVNLVRLSKEQCVQAEDMTFFLVQGSVRRSCDRVYLAKAKDIMTIWEKWSLGICTMV